MSGYVLVVESDANLQRRIGDLLRDSRYEVAAETDVSWAKRSIAVRTPDVIVLDTSLADGTGFALADELRRDPDTRLTPILFVASRRFRGAAHQSEAMRRYAPASYLIAPQELGELGRRLDAVATASASASADAGGATPSPAEAAGASSAELASARAGAGPDAVTEMGGGAGEGGVAGEGRTASRAAGATAPPEDPAQRREKRDVERTARSLSQSDADLRGTLRRTPFARLLQRLYARRATGSLLLIRDNVKKIVSFADGYPVSVRSNVLGECLGQILLQQRLISGEALQESVRRMKAEKRHQGEILVEMGVLSPYNLSRALVEQVEAKLFEVFAWSDGQYMFKQGEAPPSEALRLDRPPAALILEGIRRHYDAARQQAVLDAYAGKYVALSRDPMLRLQEVTSDPMEQAFVREIDGRTRIETVIDSAHIAREKARLLLVALSQAGMIEPGDAPVRRGETPPPAAPRMGGAAEAAGAEPWRAVGGGGGAVSDGGSDTEVELDAITDGGALDDEPLSARPATAAVPAMPLGASQLALVAQTVRSQNYFWALGVRPEDSTDAIDLAYEGLARSFHPDRYRQRSEDDRRVAQEIFDRLAEAHRALRDPARRRAYAAKQDKQQERQQRSGDVAPGPPIPGGAAKELYEAGTQHLRANRHREAVEAFRQAARMVPDQADFRAALGWALFREAPADARAGRAALGELRRAIQLDAKNRRARYYLGHLYAQTGQPDLAIAEFERLLELDPGAVDVADELRRLRESR